VTPSTWILAFDVASPKRLRQLSRFLEGKANRVQRSVFEALLTDEQLETLLKQAILPERLDPALDSLRVYRVCSSCLRLARMQGVGPALLSLRGPLVF